MNLLGGHVGAREDLAEVRVGKRSKVVTVFNVDTQYDGVGGQRFTFTAGNVSASLDGKPLGGGALGPTSATTGMVELQSGWHVAEFDNFALVSK